MTGFKSGLPPQFIQAFLRSLVGENVEFIEIPEGKEDDEEYIAKMIEEAKAKHRETCTDCAATQTQAKTSSETKAAPDRKPIGYMVFTLRGDQTRPIYHSLRETREEVEAQMERFEKALAATGIGKLLEIMEQKPPYEIRPVFGE